MTENKIGQAEAQMLAALQALKLGGVPATLKDISGGADSGYAMNVVSRLRTMGLVDSMTRGGFGFLGSGASGGGSRERIYLLLRPFEDILHEHEEEIMTWARKKFGVKNREELLDKLEELGKQYGKDRRVPRDS